MIDKKFIRTHPEPDFQYFYLGCGLIFVGILLSVQSQHLIAIPIIFLGIFLLLSVKGVIIDLQSKKYKPYLNIFFIKFGTWHSMDDISNVVLKVNSANTTLNHRGGSTTIKTDSFSIVLIGNQKKFIELKEFTDYNLAKIYLYEIAIELDLPHFDTQEEIIAKAKEARKQRK